MASELYSKSLCSYFGIYSQAEVQYLFDNIRATIKEFEPTHIWFWNGSKYIDKVILAIAKNSVNCKAFETANIPGKVVIESGGVNAASRFSTQLQTSGLTLGEFEDPTYREDEYVKWLNEYIKTKEGNRTIPQATIKQELFVEKLVSVASGIGKLNFINFDRLMGYVFKSVLVRIFVSDSSNISDNSIYFPMQVSTDSQLLFHSSLNNFDAIQSILDKNQNVQLVVNIHPAEHRVTQILRLLFLSARQGRIKISRVSSWSLIKNCSRVVTINSTIGLEAAIMGKPVEFLGLTHLSYIVQDRRAIKWYILERCIEIDDVKYPGDINIRKRLVE